MTRLGLSFEVAPPPAAHPNRTDIACFIGSVARRRPAQTPAMATMPTVLARWLASEGFARIGGIGVAGLRVDLADAEAFTLGLLAAAGDAERPLLEARLRFAASSAPRAEQQRASLTALLQACAATSALPPTIVDDLRERGFSPGALLRGDPLAAWLRVQQLLNLPVPVESFDAFDTLFEWEARGVTARDPLPGEARVVTPLGAAVRAFFAEGGRRAWIVACGAPSALYDGVAERFAVLTGPAGAPGASSFPGPLEQQLRGVTPRLSFDLLADVRLDADPVSSDGSDWRGLEHVFGLGEVDFVVMPDLADACQQALPPLSPPDAVTALDDAFHDCAVPLPAVAEPIGRRLAPPQLDSRGLQCWRQLVEHAAATLGNHGRAWARRDVQLIVSLPLLGEGRRLPAADDWLDWMARQPVAGWLLDERVQAAYPWLVTTDSLDCQGGVEAPEGTLAGVLARSALQRGAFRAASFQPVRRFVDGLPQVDSLRATRAAFDTPLGALTFAERVCLIAATPRGPQLLSDVTLAEDEAQRDGCVRRLINAVVGAARACGDELAFEPSGEALWARVRTRLADLGAEFAAVGALAAVPDAFVVRCGRDTMTQADLDAGRLVAEVQLVPARPILRIAVVLALRDSQPLVDLRAVA